MAIISVNPSTGKVIKKYKALTTDAVEKKIDFAHSRFDYWKNLSIEKRADELLKAADELRANRDTYAELLTREMGKTIKEARSEVEKCAWNFEHYAQYSEDYLKPRTVETDASESYVTYEPLGVILLVMPWNFAFWQVLRVAAPILMAGNTVVLKHASNVPGAALAIEDVFRRADVPDGVFQTLLVGSSDVEKIIENDRIKGVSLTGSENAGSMVGAQAGKAIKPVVLELGGSDPSIILADANVQTACETAAKSRLINNGQSCIASKRFIVVEEVYKEFLDSLKTVFNDYRVGDPLNEATMIGPVVSEEALNELLGQIKDSVKAGAKLIHGGNRIGTEGFYLEPTILADVKKGMPGYDQEIFGPVASVIKAKDEIEAVHIANDTRFGLGASIYTNDTDKAKQLIPAIESGSVFVNGLVKSDPRLPFGGVKKSGVGRELSAEGIRAFTNVKTVWIK